MQLTKNINLPIYEAQDVTSYLKSTGWNGAMQKIDEAIGNNISNITELQTDLTTVENQQTTTGTQITTLEEDVATLQKDTSGNTSRLNGVDQSISSIEQTLTVLNENITDVADYAGKRYNGVLTAGEETIGIEIGNFTDSTLVDVYTSIYGVNPLTIELRAATSGQPNLCVMTFDAQTVDMNVSVVTKGVQNTPNTAEKVAKKGGTK